MKYELRCRCSKIVYFPGHYRLALAVIPQLKFAPTLKKVRGKGEPIQAFTKDQVARLLEQPDRTTFTGFRDYTIFLLLLDTGIRLAELCGLRTQDVDLKEGMVKVSGKGSSGHVPFSTRCARILEKYLYYRDLRPNDSDHLFTSIRGTALSRSTIQDQFKKYGKKANIFDVRVSPHTMRHYVESNIMWNVYRASINM
ncbi:MAG: hypothetical protein FH756_08505 [Firmicutes bacterium]|nr:hypothetical protein [Bacillota bacterium]